MMKTWKFVAVALVAIFGLVLTACPPEPKTPTVTSVTINQTNISIARGGNTTFTATVTGTNKPSQAVTWAIVETTAKTGTAIDSTGKLTVADDEALSTLTVKATSKADTSKSGTTTTMIFAIITSNIEALEDYLADCGEGDTTDNPIAIKIDGNQIDWETLLSTLETSEKYVSLDFSESTGMGTFVVSSETAVWEQYLGREKIVSVILPDTIDSIGDYAFAGCENLTSITIPNSVTSIGKYAFTYSNFASITIPDSVTSIGERAFASCNLTSITIPDSVTNIESYAFSSTRLTSVTIGNGVTSIGDVTFASCANLESVTIGNSVTSIGNGAFSGCTSLTSITIPDTVITIGGGAFFNCPSLASLTIGNSVATIGNNAFYLCSSLNNIIIPNSVTTIEERAFMDCTSLTSITIPDSVTSIEEYTFLDCTSLESVIIGNGVTSIGYVAFSGCTSLVSVTFKGIITETNFNISSFSYPDLRTKYLATEGGIGTYTRESGGYTWAKQ